ncbi:MAG: tetratricopeptide repeat protein, partial [Promethearchaeota archaeon]
MFKRKKKKCKIPPFLLDSRYFTEIGHQDLDGIYDKFIKLLTEKNYKDFDKHEIVRVAFLIAENYSLQADAEHEREEQTIYFKKIQCVTTLGLKLLKKHEGLLWNLGVALFFLEKYEHALTPFKYLLKIQNKTLKREKKLKSRIIRATPLTYLAIIYSQLGNHKKATVFYKKIVCRNLGDKYSWIRLADAYRKIHKYKDAKYAYLKALEQFPNDPSIL